MLTEIRPERPEDIPAIRQLVVDAFARDFEAVVVDRLRASERFLPDLSLVAIAEGQLVGQVLVTRIEIMTASGAATPSTILAPLAVVPKRQRQGIGSALTQAALDRARALDHRSMILVGHPTYYPRFGFVSASRFGIRLSIPISDEVFMAVELQPNALRDSSGIVTLPDEFDEP